MKKAVLIFLPAIVLSILFSACGEPAQKAQTSVSTEKTNHSLYVPPKTSQTTAETTQTTPPPQTRPPETVTEYVYIDREPNYLLMHESPPEGLSLPEIDGYSQKYADVCFQVSDYAYFVTYLDLAFTGRRVSMICYTEDNGFLWDRMPRYCGEIVDFFAIDRQHFIILSDQIQMGYDIYICENGVDVDLAASSVLYVKHEDESVLDHEYILPRSEFATGTKDLNDMAFYQAVTDFRLEPIDEGSCRIVLEYVLNGEERTCCAVYDVNGLRPE